MTITLQLHADARPESIRLLRNVVVSLAEEMGLSNMQVYGLKLCVGEAITNAVQHAYPESEPGPVEVSVSEVGDELAVVVADHGHVHSPRPSGAQSGFGLAFIQRLTDGCTFTAARDGTTVEMLFPVPRARATSASREARAGSRPYSSSVALIGSGG